IATRIPKSIPPSLCSSRPIVINDSFLRRKNESFITDYFHVQPTTFQSRPRYPAPPRKITRACRGRPRLSSHPHISHHVRHRRPKFAQRRRLPAHQRFTSSHQSLCRCCHRLLL